MIARSISPPIRLNYIDLAKGIGMLFVIWGHITSIGQCFIYCFHMPLFFFLSGMMFRAEKYSSFSAFFRRKTHSLLIPYVFYSVISWIFWATLQVLSGCRSFTWLIHPLLQTLLAQGSGGFLVHNVPLWFVPCLFTAETLYYWIYKLPPIKNLVVCTVLSVLGYWMITGCAFCRLLPWSMESALTAMIFYGTGNLICRKYTHASFLTFCSSHRFLSLVFSLAAAATILFCTRYTGAVSLGSDQLDGGAFYYLAAFSGIAMVIIFSGVCSNFSGNIFPLLRWIGRNSFRFMAVHNPIKGLVILGLSVLLASSQDQITLSVSGALISFLLSLGLSSLTVYTISYLIRKKQENL